MAMFQLDADVNGVEEALGSAKMAAEICGIWIDIWVEYMSGDLTAEDAIDLFSAEITPIVQGLVVLHKAGAIDLNDLKNLSD